MYMYKQKRKENHADKSMLLNRVFSLHWSVLT